MKVRRVVPALLAFAAVSWGAPGHPATEPPASFEPYLDGVMAAVFEDCNLAGAVFCLVLDGHPAFSKGYGYADLVTRTPADPAKHLFRAASVSKLFTWTAVMQLYEQGRVRLDAPIAEYVDQFRIPDDHGDITLAHALAHTPGLEDGRLGYLYVASPDELVPLSEALARHAPSQQWPPGTVAAYSNWATALAGLVVANVSGMIFEDYVSRHILEPLGMRDSTFMEPLPPRLAAGMATGYFDTGAGLEPLGYEYLRNFGPSGALAATADDIARFIAAHVDGGPADAPRLLRPETLRRMRSRLFGPVDGMPGMAHGFIETLHNGRRFLSHGGDTIAFHSELVIDPDTGFGFFVSFNAPEGDAARDIVARAVLSYFHRAPADHPESPTGTAERVAKVVGAYRDNRRSHTKIEAVEDLTGDIAVVAGNADRIIVCLPGGKVGEYEEVAPYLFRKVDGHARLAFLLDAGAVVRALPTPPVVAYDKLAWYETATS